MKVLIIGGTGLLGGRIAERFKKEGISICVASRNQPIDSIVEWRFLDVATGKGMYEALNDVDTVIHAATNPLKQNVDVEGTSRLLRACERQGVRHFIYPSIVGIDSISMGYYKNKRIAEVLITESSVPYTIQRITQFHDLVSGLLQTLLKFPITVMPGKLQFQSVDVHEAANRILKLYQNGPEGRVRDFTGPEILTLKEMYEDWKDVYPKKQIVLPFSALPHPAVKGFKKGLNTNPDGDKAQHTWRDWIKS